MPSLPHNNGSDDLAEKVIASLRPVAERMQAQLGDMSPHLDNLMLMLFFGGDPDEIVEDIRERHAFHDAFRLVHSQPPEIQEAFFTEFARRSKGPATDHPGEEAREILATVLTKHAAKKAKKAGGKGRKKREDGKGGGQGSEK